MIYRTRLNFTIVERPGLIPRTRFVVFKRAGRRTWMRPATPEEVVLWRLLYRRPR